MVTAVYVGTDQLSLQVTDTNPSGRLLANTWAEKVTAAVNATYKLGTLAQALNSLFCNPSKITTLAQSALEELIPKPC